MPFQGRGYYHKKELIGISVAPFLLIISWMGIPKAEEWEIQQEIEDEDPDG